MKKIRSMAGALSLAILLTSNNSFPSRAQLNETKEALESMKETSDLELSKTEKVITQKAQEKVETSKENSTGSFYYDGDHFFSISQPMSGMAYSEVEFLKALIEMQEHKMDITQFYMMYVDISSFSSLTKNYFYTTLSSLPLEKLTFIYCGVDLSFLKNVSFKDSLKSLEIVGNLENTKPCLAFPNLEKLVLSNNHLENISYWVADTPNLVSLEVRDNPVKDITFLKSFSQLQSLELMNNEIEDIKALSKLKNLQYLGLSGNKIQDMTPVSSLENLESLDLSYNQLVSIPVLDLPKARYLALDSNQITSINQLTESNLPSIYSLNLQNNLLTDVSALDRSIIEPKYLFLQGNPMLEQDYNSQPILKR